MIARVCVRARRLLPSEGPGGGGGARPPLLDDAINLVVGAGLALNVEVKGDVPSRRSTARAVTQLLGRRSERERDAILLSSFDPIVLGSLGGVGVRRAFLFDRENTGLLRAALFHAAVRPEGLHPHHALCNPRRMRRWKRAGLRATSTARAKAASASSWRPSSCSRMPRPTCAGAKVGARRSTRS